MMKTTVTATLKRARAWRRLGTLLSRRWHRRPALKATSPGSQSRVGRESDLHVIGTDTLASCSGLALHYDFVQAYMDGPVLIQRHCRIRVYRPDHRLHLHPQVYPTVVVCSPMEVDFGDGHMAPIATTVWHLLGHPNHLTWIMHWWKEFPEDFPDFEEYLIQPEFHCLQFRHTGDGILTSPTFIVVSRSEVEALVGSIDMLRRPGPTGPIRIFRPDQIPVEA